MNSPLGRQSSSSPPSRNSAMRLVVLGALLIAAAGALIAFRPEPASSPPKRPAATAPAVAQQLAPGRDGADVAFTARFERSSSPWREQRKRLYSAVLASAQFDTLVVPVQIINDGFEPATRSYLTARLMSALADGNAGRIPPPDLVERGLGEGLRRFESDDIYRLARELGVERIVHVYVGHSQARGKKSRPRYMHIHARRQDADEDGRLGARTPFTAIDLDPIPLTDVFSAMRVFERHLGNILDSLGFEHRATRRTTVARLDGALGASPAPDAESNTDPARAALRLQLLGALVPAADDTLRRRLFQRSLSVLDGLSEESPDHDALKARALMYLGYRPLALELLAKPSSPTEEAIVAALNGNLYALERASTRISSPADRVLSTIALNTVRAAYGLADRERSNRSAESLDLPGNGWAELVRRKLTEHEQWEQFDNEWVKRLLDLSFPVEGYSAETVIAQATLSAAVPEREGMFAKTPLEHVRRYAQASPAMLCCDLGLDRARALDYLDLLQSVGDDNLVRRVDFLLSTQGRAGAARDLLAILSPSYDGHSAMALVRAKVEIALARQAESSEKDALRVSAANRLNDVVYWSQSHSRAARGASWMQSAESDLPSERAHAITGAPFRRDLPPYGGAGSGCGRKHQQASFDAALAAATWQVATAEAEIRCQGNDETYRAARADVLKGRFIGHPKLTLTLANTRRYVGDHAGAIAILERAIESQPAHWPYRSRLFGLLLVEARYQDALGVVEAYPPMADPRGREVEISNIAYEVGSRLLWRGRRAEAAKLHTLAAELDTGSDGSLASAADIALLDGDLASAARISVARAERYGAATAERDYLNLLHAFGRSEQAWTLFDALVARRFDARYFETALVGHRMQRRTDAEVIAWAREWHARIHDGVSPDIVARALLGEAMVDRTPSAQRIAALEEMAPAGFVKDAPLPDDDGLTGPLVARESLARSNPRAIEVTSPLVHLARAYAQLLADDAEGAVKTFRRAGANHDLSLRHLSDTAPYFAYAAVRAGNAAHYPSNYRQFTPDKRASGWYLAEAVLAASEGKHDEAEQALELSLANRARPYLRPVPFDYQLTEVLEWLWVLTGERRYRDRALEWIALMQRLMPTLGWPYAIEAVLAEDAQVRQRALEFALYLDPGSRRLESLEPKDIDAARKSLGDSNPLQR